MFLSKLHLTNFRNFTNVSLSFESANLFLGKNAQGKTNLLEAIYFLATTKSTRAEKDFQLIKSGKEFCRVEGEVGEGEDKTKLEIAMQIVPESEILEKKVKVNGVPKRGIDYLGNLVVIQFSPEDINLVAGAPALRRFHLDLTLSQIDRHYKTALSHYHSAMTSRNKVLKMVREGTARIDELDFWTDQMVENGWVLSQMRQELFEHLNSYNKSLASTLGQLNLVYQPSLISVGRLKEYLPREIAASATLIGPHRDDFVFESNSRNLAFYGSRGEQRTAVLELKLAELHYISEIKKTKPVLLLDDVFSELDSEHQNYVVTMVGRQQTIISAVETENIPQDFLKSAKVFKVEEGKVE